MLNEKTIKEIEEARKQIKKGIYYNEQQAKKILNL